MRNLSDLNPLTFSRSQLYQFAQELDGKRLSELDHDQIRVYEMLRAHPEPGWVELQSESTYSQKTHPSAPADHIWACE